MAIGGYKLITSGSSGELHVRSPNQYHTFTRNGINWDDDGYTWTDGKFEIGIQTTRYCPKAVKHRLYFLYGTIKCSECDLALPAEKLPAVYESVEELLDKLASIEKKPVDSESVSSLAELTDKIRRHREILDQAEVLLEVLQKRVSDSLF